MRSRVQSRQHPVSSQPRCSHELLLRSCAPRVGRRGRRLRSPPAKLRLAASAQSRRAPAGLTQGGGLGRRDRSHHRLAGRGRRPTCCAAPGRAAPGQVRLPAGLRRRLEPHPRRARVRRADRVRRGAATDRRVGAPQPAGRAEARGLRLRSRGRGAGRSRPLVTSFSRPAHSSRPNKARKAPRLKRGSCDAGEQMGLQLPMYELKRAEPN